MDTIDFITRHVTEDDHNFILNSFLKGYREEYPVKLTTNTIYFRGQSDVISNLLQTCNVLLAVFPDDASEVVGYIIYQHVSDALVVHWMYIKPLFRHKGIATKLLGEAAGEKKMIVATHMVDSFLDRRREAKQRGMRLMYDPFFISSQRLLNG